MDGVDTVTVSDGPVGASDGATINSFAAEVEFDVSATASDIAAEVTGSEKLAMSLMRLTLLWLKVERLFQPRMQKR